MQGVGHGHLHPIAPTYSGFVVDYSRTEAAERAGLTLDGFDRLVELGLLTPDRDDRFSAAAARQAVFFDTLIGAGVPDVALAEEFRKGTWSLDFLAGPSFANFSLLDPTDVRGARRRDGHPCDPADGHPRSHRIVGAASG